SVAKRRIRVLISSVMCGITWTVAPRNSPRRSRAITVEYTLPVVTLESRERFSSMNRSTRIRSEEHTSELQSQSNLVCRLLLEKKKKKKINSYKNIIKTTKPIYHNNLLINHNQ